MVEETSDKALGSWSGWGRDQLAEETKKLQKVKEVTLSQPEGAGSALGVQVPGVTVSDHLSLILILGATSPQRQDLGFWT